MSPKNDKYSQNCLKIQVSIKSALYFFGKEKNVSILNLYNILNLM